MITLRLAGLDFARVRFAVSPLWEAISALRAAGHRRAGHSSPWVARIAERARPLSLPFARRLVDPERAYLADFLAPPPEGPDVGFESELESMLRTPPAVVSRELGRAGLPTPAGKVPAALNRLGQELQLFWERVLRPEWPEIQSLLERDIVFRARQLAREGVGRVLAELHPSIVVENDRTVLIRVSQTSVCKPGGRGLILVPSVFSWPELYMVDALPWRPTIAYPARGVALVFDPPPATGALAVLLGKRRAGVLLASRGGATTGEMAAALRVSEGAVSQHLGRLRSAGLIRSLRTGRFVVHELTPRGEAVVGAFVDGG